MTALVLAALLATPPASGAALVDVSNLIPDAVRDMRYATADNFLHRRVYPAARCLLRREVFGREHMEACRNTAPRTGELTSSGGSSGAAPAASEPAPSMPEPVQRRLRM